MLLTLSNFAQYPHSQYKPQHAAARGVAISSDGPKSRRGRASDSELEAEQTTAHEGKMEDAPAPEPEHKDSAEVKKEDEMVVTAIPIPRRLSTHRSQREASLARSVTSTGSTQRKLASSSPPTIAKRALASTVSSKSLREKEVSRRRGQSLSSPKRETKAYKKSRSLSPVPKIEIEEYSEVEDSSDSDTMDFELDVDELVERERRARRTREASPAVAIGTAEVPEAVMDSQVSQDFQSLSQDDGMPLGPFPVLGLTTTDSGDATRVSTPFLPLRRPSFAFNFGIEDDEHAKYAEELEDAWMELGEGLGITASEQGTAPIAVPVRRSEDDSCQGPQQASSLATLNLDMEREREEEPVQATSLRSEATYLEQDHPPQHAAPAPTQRDLASDLVSFIASASPNHRGKMTSALLARMPNTATSALARGEEMQLDVSSWNDEDWISFCREIGMDIRGVFGI